MNNTESDDTKSIPELQKKASSALKKSIISLTSAAIFFAAGTYLFVKFNSLNTYLETRIKTDHEVVLNHIRLREYNLEGAMETYQKKLTEIERKISTIEYTPSPFPISPPIESLRKEQASLADIVNSFGREIKMLE